MRTLRGDKTETLTHVGAYVRQTPAKMNARFCYADRSRRRKSESEIRSGSQNKGSHVVRTKNEIVKPLIWFSQKTNRSKCA